MINGKVEAINLKFFGDEKSNRYLLDVYRECVEKLIVTNTFVEVWAYTKRSHKHPTTGNCSNCAVFFQIYTSCVDSVFLHLRLLFSMKEPALASAFLESVIKLDQKDFIGYYTKRYDHTLTKRELDIVEPIYSLTKENIAKISKLYLKRVEPYQAFAFHQPDDGKYYKVTTSERKSEGITQVIHTLERKFKRDLHPAKEMLELLADVIHLYLKASSKYYHVLKIDPKIYVKEIVALLGVESMGEEDIGRIMSNAVNGSKNLVRLLECSGGLNSHNGLVTAMIGNFQTKKSNC